LKGLVAGLALANLGFFLWTFGIGFTPDVPPAPPLDTLRLVSEMPAAAHAAPPESGEAAAAPGVAASPIPSDAAAPLPVATRCISVGPFHDVAEAAHAAGALRGGGYDPRQRVVDGDVWAGVWVYLPAPANPPAGEQLLAKLKAAGFEDALEMPGPAESSVISLGLFSDQKRAQSRVAKAQALGLTPQIADRKRTGNLYWVDVDLKPGDGAINPADLAGDPGHISRLETRACPTASPP
jgi:hypothetical protein